MSDVFEAHDARTEETVAVKVVRSGDPEFVRRLIDEAQALERFEHPGLVRLLDTGMVGDQAYLVMEYIDGPTLAESLRHGALGAPETAILGARIASALRYVHERGVVHRDVKPSNILQSARGEAWLGDFGIAKFDDATTLTAPGTTLGTVVYMAPEQLEGHAVGPSADIWSLGVVILECLTGRKVFEGSPSEIVAKRLSGPVVLPPDLPVHWKVLLNGMLDSRPDQRLDGAQVSAILSTSAYASPWETSDADLTQRLSTEAPNDRTTVMPGVVPYSAVAGDVTTVNPPTSVDDARRPGRPWLLAGAVLVAAILLYAVVAFLSSGTTSPPVTTTSQSTSTTLPSSSSALARLVADLAAAQAGGSIDPASVQSISQFADQSIIDGANGQTVAVASDLQQAMTIVVTSVAQGSTSSGVGTTIERDLVALATTLGVAAPSSSTTTTVPPPAPGNGHGNGPGRGKH